VEKSSRNRTYHTAKLPGAEMGDAVLAHCASSEASREIFSLEVECVSRAPAVVRAALGRVGELGLARDDVVLVTNELVTNAVVHSGGSPEHTIGVRATLGEGHVSISVQDPGLSDDSPRVRRSDGLRPGGWGLRIVKELTHRWGFERDEGCRVWAELRVPPAWGMEGSGPVQG
jgi:anti-sigma regulatory factor (Ser/Thr protein kinase)